jgi:iron-sulfur cluster insertion protein
MSSTGTETFAAAAPPVALTHAAAARVAELAARRGQPDLKLRLAVDGGGCSGFTYRFSLEEVAGEEDIATVTDGVTLLVDPLSLPLLEGAQVDFVETLGAASFQVKNPNAVSGCGCGSSFAI